MNRYTNWIVVLGLTVSLAPLFKVSAQGTNQCSIKVTISPSETQYLKSGDLSRTFSATATDTEGTPTFAWTATNCSVEDASGANPPAFSYTGAEGTEGEVKVTGTDPANGQTDEKTTRLVRAKIEVVDNAKLWYFNGEEPAEFPTKITMNLVGPSTGSFDWAAESGSDKVTITEKNEDGTQVEVESKGSSVAGGNDIIIKAKDGSTEVASITLSVYTVKEFGTGTVSDTDKGENTYTSDMNTDGTWTVKHWRGWRSYYEYKMKNQVDDAFLTGQIPCGETLGGKESDSPGEDWSTLDGEHGGGDQEAPIFPDDLSIGGIARERANVSSPTLPSPDNSSYWTYYLTPLPGWSGGPDSGSKIFHRDQDLNVGSSQSGKGQVVRSHTLQFYRAYGRHD